jgi:hypothetical protein
MISIVRPFKRHPVWCMNRHVRWLFEDTVDDDVAGKADTRALAQLFSCQLSSGKTFAFTKNQLHIIFPKVHNHHNVSLAPLHLAPLLPSSSVSPHLFSCVFTLTFIILLTFITGSEIAAFVTASPGTCHGIA